MKALELIVDEGRSANAGRFFRLGTDLLSLLDELSDVPVAWQVQDLRLSSAVARLAPPPDHSEEDRWLGLAVDSLGAVQQGGALPDTWTPDAVRAAHRFVEHGQPAEDEQDWRPPRLVLVGDANQPGPSVVLTADLSGRLADMQPFERRMPGSVRGTLVGLNVSRGNRASLRLSNKRIVRIGFENSLRENLKEALYQPVEVRGVARQDGDGRVFHVRAEQVDVLVRPDARWSDLFGMDPSFTGDLSTDEWLEANRGEA